VKSKPIRIAPSILAADFGRLHEQLEAMEAAGADYVHVDVMDGSFVPNITIGQPVVAAARRATRLPLDVHLMIRDPDRHIAGFAEAGADLITVHVEACTHLHRTLQTIASLGKRAGVALNPATSLETVRWVLGDADMVLVMSVNPGFGGQKFIDTTLHRLRSVRAMAEEQGADVDIQVDGGVVVDNAESIAAAGGNVLVSGTGILGREDWGLAVETMRRNGERGRDAAATPIHR
jgi:ribulose-phosphate 3-epimerase